MALPERLVSNDQIAANLDVDPDWIAKRTGTCERPWALDGELLSDSPRTPLAQPWPTPTSIRVSWISCSSRPLPPTTSRPTQRRSWQG
jgi:hypothetical protein